ncbi:MAG: PAS domain S-box protein [bacterium]|nr:PAS domain S-box protein [bacterium]
MTELNTSSYRLLHRVVLTAGGISAMLGMLILTGWYIQSMPLARLFSSFTPMEGYSALGFLLCGAGFLLVCTGRNVPAMACGGLATVMGILMGQLISPNGMSPNTALCFTLSGTGLVLIAKAKPFKWRPLVIWIIGSVIVALGGVAIFGYLSGVEAAYRWGDLPPMVVHEALGFITVGVGLFSFGWREGINEESGSVRWLAIPAGITLAAIAFFQWLAMRTQERNSVEMRYPMEESPLPAVILAAGILMALLLTITIHLAQKLWGRARIVERTNRELEEEINERKRVEEALRKSEGKYRLLADNTLDCIWRMDLDFKYTYINPSVLPMFGYTPVEWIGSALKDHCSPRDLAYIKGNINHEMEHAGEIGMIFETHFLHKDGHEIPVEINGKLLRDEAGTPVEIQGTIRDIKERKKVEEEKGELEDLLRQAHKMEAIGTLAGGIAHDFNNILGVLMGYAELSLEELPEDSPIRQNLRHVMASAERARQMVKQILAFSRKSEIERIPVYLHQMVTESLKLLRSSIPTTIDIRSYIEESVEPVFADATQIHQVVMNLCSNAAYAMRESGGILEIKLKTIFFEPDGMGLKELDRGKYHRLTVKDNGHGIGVETLKRIFDPYFTTKKVGEGTGMGLAVVHGIIKDHGGEITVKSESWKGTSFDVYLPVAKGEIVPVENTKAQPSMKGGDECILLVDDEQAMVEMGKQMLEKLGYCVVSRVGSIEALEAFRAAPGKFNLVITDQTMPNMTGVHLTREIKKVRADIPVILCTGFSESVNEENFKALGIDGFVLKPIIKKRIASVIRDVLDRIS